MLTLFIMRDCTNLTLYKPNGFLGYLPCPTIHYTPENYNRHCTQGPFTNIADKSNQMLSNMQDEITYPFPNFNGCIIEAWEWISNVIPT